MVLGLQADDTMPIGFCPGTRATLARNVSPLIMVRRVGVSTGRLTGPTVARAVRRAPAINDRPGLGIDMAKAKAVQYPCKHGVTTWTQTRMCDE